MCGRNKTLIMPKMASGSESHYMMVWCHIYIYIWPSCMTNIMAWDTFDPLTKEVGKCPLPPRQYMNTCNTPLCLGRACLCTSTLTVKLIRTNFTTDTSFTTWFYVSQQDTESDWECQCTANMFPLKRYTRTGHPQPYINQIKAKYTVAHVNIYKVLASDP